MIACPFCSGPLEHLTTAIRGELEIHTCPCRRFIVRYHPGRGSGVWSLYSPAGAKTHMQYMMDSLWMMRPDRAPDLVLRKDLPDTIACFDDLCLIESVLAS